MIRLRNGLGWIDATSGQWAMPPDGETFALAPGAPAEGARWFHVVEVPELVAVVAALGAMGERAPDEDERARTAGLLADHFEHTAFVIADREGAAVVGGHGTTAVIATAVAALKAIGGWDASVPIAVEVNGEKIDVRLSHDNRGWRVEVDAMLVVRALPHTDNTILLRTYFGDDAAWDALLAAVQQPVGEFRAYVTPISDAAFDDAKVDDVAKLASEAGHTFVLIADRHAFTDPEHPVLVLDVYDEPGRTFRVVPSEAWGVENNLSLANMDFDDFASAVDADGVFRGFRE